MYKISNKPLYTRTCRITTLLCVVNLLHILPIKKINFISNFKLFKEIIFFHYCFYPFGLQPCLYGFPFIKNLTLFCWILSMEEVFRILKEGVQMRKKKTVGYGMMF